MRYIVFLFGKGIMVQLSTSNQPGHQNCCRMNKKKRQLSSDKKPVLMVTHVGWMLVLLCQPECADSLVTQPRLSFKYPLHSTNFHPLHRYPQQQQTACFSSLPIEAQNSTEEYEEWEAGDIEGDLERLEREFGIRSGWDALEHGDLVQIVIEDGSRPLFRDLRRYAVGPLLAALAWTTLCKSWATARVWSQLCFKGMDVYFWTVFVAAPILLFRLKQKLKPPVISRFVRLLEKRACTFDYVYCLLEEVSSTAIGMALMGRFIGRILWPAASFLTQLGALAAWYRYYYLYYKLMRKNQPRPVTREVFVTQLLRKLQGNTWLLVPALTRLMIPWNWDMISHLYLYLGVTYVAARIHPKLLSYKANVVRLTFLLLAGFSLTSWIVARKRFLRLLTKVVRLLGTNSFVYNHFLRHHVHHVLAFLVAILVPLRYMIGYRNNFQVKRITNFPCDMEPDEERRAACESWKQEPWRWEVVWREKYKPKPPHDADDSELEEIRRKYDVMGLLKGPAERKRMIQETMDQVKREHANNLAQGNFEDPLGLALYRTFDIGIGFDSSHLTPLKRNQTVSLERLFTRAAKSAIRRVNELTGLDSPGRREALSKATNTRERQEILDGLDRQAQAEKDRLAKRLTELTMTRLYKGEDRSELSDLYKFYLIPNDDHTFDANPQKPSFSKSVENLLKEAERTGIIKMEGLTGSNDDLIIA